MLPNFLFISWILLTLQLFLKHSFTWNSWTLHYFDVQSINNGALDQTVFYGSRVKYFFASNFLISSWISIKTVPNSQQKRFKQLRKYFCVKLMVSVWRTLLQKGVIFVTFPQHCRSPKPDMVKILLFAQIFQSLCLRKRINLMSTLHESLKSYNTLKSHMYTHTEIIFWYWSFNKLLQVVLQISLFVG